MSYKLEVHEEGKSSVIITDGHDFLLSVLRDDGHEVYSPCGGNGTCGKCRVHIKGVGTVAACRFPIMEDITVVLPEKTETQILVTQHQYTLKMPVQPGVCSHLSYNPYGIAIDIGTTSLVFYLVDLIMGGVVETRAQSNPQALYGADVITRIAYVARDEEKLKRLQHLMLDVINEQMLHFRTSHGLREVDIVKMSIAGNTTMLHLLLGVDPLSISLAPFTPTFLDRQVIKPAELGLKCNPEAYVEAMPGISAYVGADILAGLGSVKAPPKVKTWLLMDIGTNGELALVTPDNIYCCAAPAGPAFEGAKIEYGMIATEGAISTFTGEGYTVIGDKPPVGICGSGLIDLLAYLIDEGVVDEEGNIAESYQVAPADVTGTGEPIYLTQKDIREVQLAKSAIAAGVKIMITRAGIKPDQIDAVFLAGGFGNYINIKSAMTIGLIMPAFEGKVIPIGNSSGTGAVLSLKSEKFAERLDELKEKSINIELSDEDSFALEFAMNMMFGDSLMFE